MFVTVSRKQIVIDLGTNGTREAKHTCNYQHGDYISLCINLRQFNAPRIMSAKLEQDSMA